MKWVSLSGVKYTKLDYVLVGWQDDDMPKFGRVDDILVVKGQAFFTVSVYHAFGIDLHYHSYCIQDTSSCEVILVSQIQSLCPNTFRAHEYSNGHLYITSRSLLHKCY